MTEPLPPPDDWAADLEEMFRAAEAGELGDVDASESERVALTRAAHAVRLALDADGDATDVVAPPMLRAKVLDAIRAEAEQRAIAPTPLPEPTKLDDARKARWRPRPLAAIAAAVAVIVGALVGFAPGTGTSVAFATDLVAAPGSPSPGATGRAELLKTKHGYVMRLKAKGLSPDPSGAVYQCWYIGDGDSPTAQNRIAVGTFRTANGSIEVEWPTATDPERFPKVGVTLEPDDGNPLRTGPKVLVAAPKGS